MKLSRYLVLLLIPFVAGLYVLSRSRETVREIGAGVEVTPETVQAAHEPDPLRVGIQVGHWKADELPDELENLRYSTGASAGGYDEWEVMLDIATDAAETLRTEGIEVDILPATIPRGYEADAFISLHADGNEDTSVQGYKATGSNWDANGSSARLAAALEAAYDESGLYTDSDNVTQNMTEYYAFNYLKFVHAVHPNTPAAILETGYLTNRSDRTYLVRAGNPAADLVAAGIRGFLSAEYPDRH